MPLGWINRSKKQQIKGVLNEKQREKKKTKNNFNIIKLIFICLPFAEGDDYETF